MRAHSSRLVAPSSVLILMPVLALAIDAGACDRHTVVGQDLNPGQGGSRATAPCIVGKTLSLPLRSGEQVASVTIGDWNGDGRGDMATVNQTTGAVSVWLASGLGGTFARTDYPGACGGELVQGDWNGDDAWDLATAQYTKNSVSVLFGRGDGTFAQAPSLATEASPLALAAGDLNGDGQTDLVSVSGVDASNSGTISVWLGTQAGLGPRQDHPGLGFGLDPSFIVMGDFDDNGTMDLVTGRSGYSVKILLGDGAGQFAAPQTIGLFGHTAAVADFNHDGHLDLGVADSGGRGWTGSVSLMAGTGSGSFSGGRVLLPQNSSSVLAGDFDRDGYADLAALASDQLNVWHGDEQGLSETYKTYPASASGMAMGDLNCDGTPDIATTAWTSVSVLFADRDGF